MPHNHAHHGHHCHSAPPNLSGKAFALAAGLNLVFVLVEAGYGFTTHSMALLGDAAHNFADVVGLLITWGAAWLAQRNPTTHYTYGLRRTSILAALANAALLLISVGALGIESLQRLLTPHPVPATTVMIVAGIGVVINLAAASIFMRNQQHDLNVRGAYLHMVADAALSLAVVVGGFIMLKTGWYGIDAILGLILAAAILWGTWDLAKQSLHLALDGVPEGIRLADVHAYLASLEGVTEVHDLHIWAMSTTEVACTAHLVHPASQVADGLIHQATHHLGEKFGIHHTTLQLELGPCGEGC